MKNAIPYVLVVLFATGFGVVYARNRQLGAELEEAQAKISRLGAEADFRKASAAPAPRVARMENLPAPAKEAEAPEIDTNAFEQAVEERVAQRVEADRRRRQEEREARRKEWENMSDEERDARRRGFQDRMREHASARVAEFVKKANLDDAQCAALESELGLLDSRIHEISSNFAKYLDDGGSFGFETQMQMLSDVSAVVLDAYAGLDEALPQDWRESDGDFNVMFGISPESINPLMDSLRRSGMRGIGGGFPPFMGPPPGGGRQRGPRGQNGN